MFYDFYEKNLKKKWQKFRNKGNNEFQNLEQDEDKNKGNLYRIIKVY